MANVVVPENLDIIKTRRRVEDALRKFVTTEKLVNIAGELKVELALLPEPEVFCHHCYCPCSFCSSHDQDLNRPNFGPDQVRCKCQLREGLHYVLAHKDLSYRQSFTLLKPPYLDRPSGWWIEVKIVGRGRSDKISLQDMSVEPYLAVSYPKHRMWNQTNWIAFTDESKPRCGCCHHQCFSHR